MKRAIMVALFLSGCATGPTPEQVFTDSETACLSAPLTSFGPCLQHELDVRMPDWRNHAHADLVQIYIAWANAAAAKVVANQMTEPEFRLDLAIVRSRLKEIAIERDTVAQYRAQAQSQSAMSLMLGGVALMNAADPPSSMVQCTQTGNTVTCY